MSKLNIFVPITKVDAVKGIVYGTLAAEELDHSGEIFDYAGSKPYFEKWSAGISKATAGKSLGNLRAMHGSVAAGKFTSMNFNDDDKRIEVAAKIVDKGELEKAIEGVYTGFSIGGKYVSRTKKSDGAYRYIADPYEGSLVDLPCIPSATFEVIKADGATLQKKFNPVGDVEKKARELCKAAGKDPDATIDDAERPEQKITGWVAFENDAIEALAKAVDPADPKTPAVDPNALNGPKNDEVVAKAKEMAKAAGNEDAWLDHIEPARTALKAAGAAPAPAKVDLPAPAPGATASDDGTEVQVWAHKRLPGKTFAKKAELRQALAELDADEAATRLSKGVKDQLAELTGALNERENPVKKAAFMAFAAAAPDDVDASLQKASGLSAEDWVLAGQFAGDHPTHAAVKALGSVELILNDDDTVKEMPAATIDALKALVVAAKAPAPAEVVIDDITIADKDALLAVVKDLDPKKPLGFLARRRITKAAFEFDAVDALPKDWNILVVSDPIDLKKIAAGELKKSASLYSIGSLIQLLAQVDSCEESLEAPGYGYGTMVPKALCDRFGSVLVEMGDIVAEVLDVVLAEMRDEESMEASGSVMRIAKALASFNQLVVDQPLVKAGARHSRADTNMINQVHTLAVGLGADCAGDDEAEKATVSTLRKKLETTEGAFAKAMGEVSTLVKDIAERVKRIEAQPLPEGTSSYRTVEKGRDIPIIDGNGANDPDQLVANAQVFADLSNLIVRGAHANPHHDVPGYMRRRPY